jgi:hypothetical protein
VNLALAAILPTTDTKMSGELVPDEHPDPAPSHCLIHHLHVAKRSPSAASAESSMHNSKASECVAASPKVYRHNRPTAYFSPMISLLLPVRFSVTASVA